MANGANEYTSFDPDGPSQGSPCTIGCLAPVSPAYDKAGNLIFDPLAELAGQVGTECGTGIPPCGPGLEYEYDGENRLVRVRKDTNNAQGLPDGQGGQTPIAEQNVQMEFVYDALGRRIETIEYVDPATGAVWDGQGANQPPRRTRHVYIGLEMIQEYVCGGDYVSCEAGPALIREFVHGDPERYPEAVAMLTYMHELHGVPPGEPPLPATPHFVEAYHYLHDSLGSVIGLVDEDGALVERYTYDPYGKVFIEARDLLTGEYVPAETDCGAGVPACGRMPYSPIGNPFGFTGHVYLPAVGLVFAPKRVYDPVLGRWLQRDPIEYEAGSINLYEYVLSAPLYWFDPFGLAAYPGRYQGFIGNLNPVELTLWDNASRMERIDLMVSVHVAFDAVSGPEYDKGIHNGPGDAVRHCTWNCTMARLMGADKAKKWGDAHEDGDPNNPPDETDMDKHNNRCGIDLSEESKSEGWIRTSDGYERRKYYAKSCKELCEEKLKNGKLKVLPKSEWGDRPGK